MTEWKPIETAPKDGTKILICVWDIGGYWDMEVSQWLKNVSYKDEFGKNKKYTGFAPDVGIGGPTHWMPLPAPPKD